MKKHDDIYMGAVILVAVMGLLYLGGLFAYVYAAGLEMKDTTKSLDHGTTSN